MPTPLLLNGNCTRPVSIPCTSKFQGFEGIQAKQDPHTGKRVQRLAQDLSAAGLALLTSKLHFNSAPGPKQEQDRNS